MSDGKDDSEKTEDPTHKRLEDAQKKGQIYQSREINSFLILFTFLLLLAWLMDDVLINAAAQMAQFIQRPDTMPTDKASLGDILEVTVFNIAGTMAIPMLAFMAAALIAGLGQKPLVLSTDPMKPKFEKISPMKGLKRMFSMKSVTEFLKGMFKITVAAVICFLVIYPEQGALLRMPNTDIPGLLSFLKAASINMLIGVVTIMFFIALIDYFYQRYEYLKNLRMSKQDIKDEYKQQEGDPKIKQRLRQIRMERAQNSMMGNVPTADVVITNPTHYAVALKYDKLTMNAPRIVAKGEDKVALRIRESATKHEVAIVENKPLARALYTVDIDEEVPLDHYKAVAEVISFVYKQKGMKFN